MIIHFTHSVLCSLFCGEKKSGEFWHTLECPQTYYKHMGLYKRADDWSYWGRYMQMPLFCLCITSTLSLSPPCSHWQQLFASGMDSDLVFFYVLWLVCKEWDSGEGIVKRVIKLEKRRILCVQFRNHGRSGAEKKKPQGGRDITLSISECYVIWLNLSKGKTDPLQTFEVAPL